VDFEAKANELRHKVLDLCNCAQTGHVTSSFSCVEILVALYYKIMRKDFDRLILSKAQASPILYLILADLGYFPAEQLKTWCKKGGFAGVHLQKSVPGAEITSGSLGHGFGIAAGLALAARKDREKHLIFTLLGDGELYEGSVWETAMFASHNRLNNLVAIVDRNYVSATNYTEDGLSLEPLEKKWESFGWNVKRINGHDFGQIFKALDGVRSRPSVRPLVIIADTVKGKGVEFIEDDPAWHSRACVGEDYERAKGELK